MHSVNLIVGKNVSVFHLGEAEQTLLSVQTIHNGVMARTVRCLYIVHNLFYIIEISCPQIKKYGAEVVAKQ